AHQGVKLSQIRWPPHLPFTAVPYIERMATADVTVNGHGFKQGDRLRLYFDACSSLTGQSAERLYFGKGRHTCLGRGLSQKAWEHLTAYMSRLDLWAELGNVQFRHNDYVFNYPSVI